MKVLIFMTQFYQLGGAEKLAVELAEKLNERGIHADILSMYTEDIPGVIEAKETILNKGIPAVHFLGMKIHPSIASMAPAALKLRRLIHKHGYDIIETSLMSPTIIASFATLGMRVRHIAGLHQVFTKKYYNSKKHMFLKLSTQLNRYIRYYAISDYVAEDWIKYSGTSARHIRRIYNSISDDYFTTISDRTGVRNEFELPQDGRIAIYVGRLAAYKGLNTLLDALGPILQKHNLFLLYIGNPDIFVKGTKAMLEQMEKKIEQRNWSERVKFISFRDDIPRLMASANILVHPTQKDGFGLVLAEAMASGLPVVATNVEGIPEVLSETDSIMVAQDDSIGLREAVLKTLNRSSDNSAIAIQKGRNKAQFFRNEIRTDAMINLFKDVLSDRL